MKAIDITKMDPMIMIGRLPNLSAAAPAGISATNRPTALIVIARLAIARLTPKLFAYRLNTGLTMLIPIVLKKLGT
jgi:hypothetical protein